MLVVLVCDLEIHLIRNPRYTDPDHDSQGVGELPAQAASRELNLGRR